MNDIKPGSGWLPEQILNAFSDPVCMIDSSGLIIAANTHFISIFSPDYDGDPKKTIYNDEAINSCQNALRKCINTILNGSKMGLTGGDFQCTVDKNNFTELFTFSVSPIHSEQNPPTFMIRAYRTSGSEEEKTPKYRENFFTYVFEILTRLSTTQEVDNEILIFLSKLGRIMGSDYVSFFESNPESIKQDIIPEVIIWSQRDGLSMASSGKDPESGEFFIRTKPVPEPNIPAFFTLDQVPEYFHAMMVKRQVNSVRIFPAIAQSTFTGSFVFWNKNLDIWTDEEITMIQSLVSIIGHNLYWFKIGNELTRSEEMFQGVLEYIGDMYFLTDKTGDLLVISPSMASSLEYDTLDELKGKNFQSLLKYPEIWPGFLSEIIQENSLRDYQMILRGKNGKVVVGSVSCRLTYDQNEGSLIGIEGVIRDITRRKQYEQMMNETEWRLKQAQKIARLGVWSYSMSTRAFRVSPEIFSILALPISKGEVCLEDITMITSTGDHRRLDHHFSVSIPEGKEFEVEFKIMHPNGKFKFLKMRGEPIIRMGEIRGSFGIIQDITERKEVEQYLLKYANELEKKTIELDEMRTQLLDMNRDLDQRVRKRASMIEELLRQKDEFIVQIGHDLKTPLTPLFAILPHLRKKISDPGQIQLLDIAIEDVKTIKEMITRILDLAQMNALFTISEIQQVELRSLLEIVIRDNAYLIHQKNLTVQNDIPPDIAVKISPMHFETMMANLISNSVKYSYLDGTIRISASDQGDIVILHIQDNGIGIAEKDISRIFDEFYKADSSRHDLESHGLGLTIAKRVIEIYNGKIWVESEGTGKGSTFHVQLKKEPVLKGIRVP